MSGERHVAGLWCGEVLKDLSGYLDGELPATRVQDIEAHLRGCDWCERFGQEFSGVIGQLREQLGAAPEPPGEVTDRLWDRLDGELGETP